MPLNDRQIKYAKPADKAYKVSDGHGLHLLMKPSGDKNLRYLSQYPKIPLKKYRKINAVA